MSEMGEGPRGGGWHGPSVESKDKGFRMVKGIPTTLLLERAKFSSRWVCEAMKARGQKKPSYVVWNKMTGDVVWVGDDKGEGEALQQRLAGWQEAEVFPPPKPTGLGMVEAPHIQLVEPDDTPVGPTQDPLLVKRKAESSGN